MLIAQLKAIVRTRLKPAITDVNGVALLASLKAAGFSDITDVRRGKVIEIEFEGDVATAQETVTDMCKQLLAHPYTDIFEFDLFTQAIQDGKPTYFPLVMGETVEVVEEPTPPHYQIDLSDENIVFGRYHIRRAIWSNPDTFCIIFTFSQEGNQENPLGLRMDLDKKAFLDDLPDAEASAALHENRERMWDLVMPGYRAVCRKFGELAQVEAAEAEQDAAVLAQMGLS